MNRLRRIVLCSSTDPTYPWLEPRGARHHLTTQCRAKRGAWDKFVAAHGDPDTAPAAYLLAKGYLPHIVEGARVIDMSDVEVTFEHRPCPKFRVIIPLARPWLAAAYESQALANAAWKERIEALAAALCLHHDQSCTDTSRLFNLPRRQAAGPPAETEVLEGTHCDIFALPASKTPLHEAGRRVLRTRPAVAADGWKPANADLDRDDASFNHLCHDTGEIIDLHDWAQRGGGRFQLRSALQARRPDVFLGRVIDGTKHHLACVNADEHSSTDADAATIVIDASESENKGFVHFCHHSHCVTRDRLFFVRKMLVEGWLRPADLESSRFYVGGEVPRPVIRYVAGELHQAVDDAEQVLLSGASGIYQRGSVLVRAGVVTVDVDQRDTASLRLIEVQEMALVEVLTRLASWKRIDARKNDWARIDAPNKVAKAYLQRTGRWRLPTLAGLLDAPTLRSDGSILDHVGYDAQTGLLLLPLGKTYPPILVKPTKAQAQAALATLIDLLRTYPFVDDASKSVALSAILTASIRRSLRTAPLHAFTAPVAGSGKSSLVDIASLIATGREASVISQGQKEEELEKRLGALLMAGDLIIAIDNCERPVNSEFLCSMLTQAKVRPRILGRSEVPELPANALITATGNNLVLVGDLTRRAIVCNLDPKVERPELREFTTKPLTMAREHRARYLLAALTVLKAYHAAGQPEQPAALGSFEAWSGWVRGALLWLGQADPVATMEGLRNQDPALECHAAVLAQWWAIIGPKRVSSRTIIDHAIERCTTSGTAMSHLPEFRYPDFREALLAVAGEHGVINSRKLGCWITRHEDRIVHGMRIVRCGLLQGIMTWRLEQSAKCDTAPEATPHYDNPVG